MAELHDDALARHLKERERQYELDEITLEYAIAWDEGQSPRVVDFAARYPAFAREISAFALYYATIGHTRDAPEPEPALAPAAVRALGQIAAEIAPRAQPVAESAAHPAARLDGLMRRGARVGYPAPQLATRVGLSPDVLAKLEARRIEAATVPEALVRRLAATLHVTPTAVTTFLSGPRARRGSAPQRASAPRRPEREPFLEAVRASALTPEQKDEWTRIAAGEAPGTP
jgi:hypothetical protein